MKVTVIGIPREIKEQESRVALQPSGAYMLAKQGHRVIVENEAGIGSGFSNEEYRQAGAEIVETAQEVFSAAELIVKVKEPQPQEVEMLTEQHTLFTYLHLAADKPLTEGLLRSRCTGLAYETIEIGGRLPLLEPMSEIAGRMSAMVGAYHLAKHRGGSGVLLSGVPGVLRGRVVVLGGGSAGVNAARVAAGMGAEVTILELNHERMRHLEDTLNGIDNLYSNESNLKELLPQTDLLIGAVLVPGAKAPKLITREMLREMRPGSVMVDIAVDQGGCAETTRATTHAEPTFIEEGIVHYCVANMPGAYARTATQALTNSTFDYVQHLANQGVEKAFQSRPELVGGMNCYRGNLTCQAVAQAHDLVYTPYTEVATVVST